MNCPYCDNPVIMGMFIICPVCHYAMPPLEFQIALEAKATEEVSNDQESCLPLYGELEDIMLLLYLKHHNQESGITDIPAWTRELYDYLEMREIP